MAIALEVFDQVNTNREPAVTLRLVSNKLTVAELIKQRVKQEVDEYNEKQPEIFRGLVQPTAAERLLNGFKLKKNKTLNVESQQKAALKGFEAGSIFLLVDDRQIEALDEIIEVHRDTEVIFLKLVPLIGG